MVKATALIVCEKVIFDATWSTISIFSELRCDIIPHVMQGMAVYAAIKSSTDEPVALQISIVGPGNQEICSADCEVKDWTEQRFADFACKFRRTVFPVAGVYVCRLCEGASLLMERDFRVTRLPAGSER